MASKKKKRKIIRRPKTPAHCSFCENKEVPNYKNYGKLKTYMSERGRILSSDYTGFCTRHQRNLSRAIKRARSLGLLSSTPSL